MYFIYVNNTLPLATDLYMKLHTELGRLWTSVDDDKGSRRLPKKIEERLIRGKYRETPTSDYGVKHKASLLIIRIYTCVLMLYKGRRSRTHPV